MKILQPYARVSFGDFEMTVKNDPLMMEAFGPCLPNSALGKVKYKKYKAGALND